MSESASIPSFPPAAQAVTVMRAHPAPQPSPAAPVGPSALLSERWPTLSAAMSQYEHNTAEIFTRDAYDCVEMGLVRLDARQALARRADELGIKPFDAQLLIACAVRQWSLDHRYEPLPSLSAPRLSPEYASWKRVSLWFALVLGIAATVDWMIIVQWLR